MESYLQAILSPVLKNLSTKHISIGLILKIDLIVEKIAGTRMGETGYAFMIDNKGVVIAHPKRELILELEFKSVKGMETIINSMLARQQGQASYVFEGVEKVAAYAPVELTGWSVAGTLAKDELLASANAIRNGILLIGCIFVGFTIILVLFLSRSISRPNARVADGLNEGADQVAAASGEQAQGIDQVNRAVAEMDKVVRQNSAPGTASRSKRA